MDKQVRPNEDPEAEPLVESGRRVLQATLRKGFAHDFGAGVEIGQVKERPREIAVAVYERNRHKFFVSDSSLRRAGLPPRKEYASVDRQRKRNREYLEGKPNVGEDRAVTGPPVAEVIERAVTRGVAAGIEAGLRALGRPAAAAPEAAGPKKPGQ